MIFGNCDVYWSAVMTPVSPYVGLLRRDESNSPVAGHGRNHSRPAWLPRPLVAAAASVGGGVARPPPPGCGDPFTAEGVTPTPFAPVPFGFPSRTFCVLAPPKP